MLNTISDKVLNAPTVTRILLSKKVESKYLNLRSYKYEIKSNFNTVYVKIKDEHKDKLNAIVNDIEQLFTIDIELNNKKVIISRDPPKNPIYNYVLVLEHSGNVLRIVFPILKPKLAVPRILRPGIANEDFFEALVKSPLEFIEEQCKDIKQFFPGKFSPTLTLFVYEGPGTSPSAKIGPIKKIEQVGEERDEEGYQKKPDIRITTNSGVIENISIKMNEFPGWSSASRYTGARYIMDELTQKTDKSDAIVTINGLKENRSFTYNGIQYSGLVFPATTGEVEKFCFNGDEIKYIIVKTFSNSDIISEVSQYGNNLNNFKIDFKVNSIFVNNPEGVRKLKPNVFLLIKSKNISATGLVTNDNKYAGFSVSFIPRNKIKPYYASINNLSSIEGRL